MRLKPSSVSLFKTREIESEKQSGGRSNSFVLKQVQSDDICGWKDECFCNRLNLNLISGVMTFSLLLFSSLNHFYSLCLFAASWTFWCIFLENILQTSMSVKHTDTEPKGQPLHYTGTGTKAKWW